MNLRRSTEILDVSRLGKATASADQIVLSEESFRRMISLERKRSERSRKPFLLMLLDAGRELPTDKSEKALSSLLSALALSTRETDVKGWYRNNSVVGVMFTEIAMDGTNSIVSTILARVSGALRNNLSADLFSRINISFHLFPEDWDPLPKDRSSNPALYPDLLDREDSKRAFRIFKRAIDVVGSVSALLMFSPLVLIIAAAIRLTTKGPVFFAQERIGQYGTPFKFLKFRSMHLNNDCITHKEYVKRFIAGEADKVPANGNGAGVYKLANDSRITRVGSLLRRSSLDELPQLFNVLRGEMSLVGPRPALSYEVEAYDLWHRGRVLEAKPGMTGLWQVNGRSRVKFDDMVRLDLQYARTCSPWLDLKILMQTPRAVLLGGGAY